jgi:hypothetical protein
MRRFSAEAVIGCVLLVFSVAVYLIIPSQVAALMRYDASMGLSPAVFPKFAVMLIAAFSILLIVSGSRSKESLTRSDKQAFAWRPGIRIIVTFGIFVAYVFLIDIFGYFVMTPLALAGLMWYFGEKNWLLMVFLAVFITISLYLFFRYIMYIILPEGILFS